MRPGVVAIGKRGVRAGVVAVALARRGLRQQGVQPDRVGQAQRMQKIIGPAELGQCLGPAQMGVHVHQPHLAAKVAGALTALEQAHRAAAVTQRPVKQPQAVGAQQVPADQIDMGGGLGRAEQAVDDGMHHRQRAVADAGAPIPRMQQVIDLAGRLE